MRGRAGTSRGGRGGDGHGSWALGAKRCAAAARFCWTWIRPTIPPMEPRNGAGLTAITASRSITRGWSLRGTPAAGSMGAGGGRGGPRLFTVGARVRQTARWVWVHRASGWPYQETFRCAAAAARSPNPKGRAHKLTPPHKTIHPHKASTADQRPTLPPNLLSTPRFAAFRPFPAVPRSPNAALLTQPPSSPGSCHRSPYSSHLHE